MLWWAQAGLAVGLVAGAAACTQASPAAVFGVGLALATLAPMVAPRGQAVLCGVTAAGIAAMAVALLASTLFVVPVVLMVTVAALAVRDIRQWARRLNFIADTGARL